MKKYQTLTIATLLCLASAAFAEQNQDELKQRILTKAQNLSADDYAFTRTIAPSRHPNGGKRSRS